MATFANSPEVVRFLEALKKAEDQLKHLASVPALPSGEVVKLSAQELGEQQSLQRHQRLAGDKVEEAKKAINGQHDKERK